MTKWALVSLFAYGMKNQWTETCNLYVGKKKYATPYEIPSSVTANMTCAHIWSKP